MATEIEKQAKPIAHNEGRIADPLANHDVKEATKDVVADMITVDKGIR